MGRLKDDGNPYQPPAAVTPGIGGDVYSFQVGVDEIHTVFIEWSCWTGLKTHSTDPTGIAGAVHRGSCRFEVGQREPHQVVIEVDRLARVNAYVDGELVGKNLMPKFRLAIIVALSICVLVGVILFLFGFLGFEKLIEQWFESRW